MLLNCSKKDENSINCELQSGIHQYQHDEYRQYSCLIRSHWVSSCKMRRFFYRIISHQEKFMYDEKLSQICKVEGLLSSSQIIPWFYNFLHQLQIRLSYKKWMFLRPLPSTHQFLAFLFDLEPPRSFRQNSSNILRCKCPYKSVNHIFLKRVFITISRSCLRRDHPWKIPSWWNDLPDQDIRRLSHWCSSPMPLHLLLRWLAK